MKPLTIALDVDEVCADLLGEWMRRYNAAWGDNILPENITEWDLTKHVKKECGQRVYEILHEPDLYEHVLPIKGARTAAHQLLADGHRVIYVTACAQGTVDRKVDWLVRNQFLTKASVRTDFIAAGDKSLVRADFLFDDRWENVTSFRGHSVLVTQGHNRSYVWNRVGSLADAPQFIKAFPFI